MKARRWFDSLFARSGRPPRDADEIVEYDRAGITFPGRLVRLNGRWIGSPSADVQSLDVEVPEGREGVAEADEAIDWQPHGQAHVHLRSGSMKVVQVDLAATSAGGRIEPGMAFRVALRLAAGLREHVITVIVVSGTAVLRISVQ